MATKAKVTLSQVEFERLDEVEAAANQAIGFMELVLKDILDRYERDGTEFEKETAGGICELQYATRKRLEKAVEGLFESAQQHACITVKAPPKGKTS